MRVEGLDWVWERKSEHHPTGYYRIPPKLSTGDPVVKEVSEKIDLEIRAAENATVQFTWELDTYDELAIPEPLLVA